MADWMTTYTPPPLPSEKWPTAYINFQFECGNTAGQYTFKVEAEKGRYFLPVGLRLFVTHHKFSIMRLIQEHSKESGLADYTYIEGPMDAGEFRIGKNPEPNKSGAVMMPFVSMQFAVVSPSSPLVFEIERHTDERIFQGYLAGDWVNPGMDYYGVARGR